MKKPPHYGSRVLTTACWAAYRLPATSAVPSASSPYQGDDIANGAPLFPYCSHPVFLLQVRASCFRYPSASPPHPLQAALVRAILALPMRMLPLFLDHLGKVAVGYADARKGRCPSPLMLKPRIRKCDPSVSERNRKTILDRHSRRPIHTLSRCKTSHWSLRQAARRNAYCT